MGNGAALKRQCSRPSSTLPLIGPAGCRRSVSPQCDRGLNALVAFVEAHFIRVGLSNVICPEDIDQTLLAPDEMTGAEFYGGGALVKQVVPRNEVVSIGPVAGHWRERVS